MLFNNNKINIPSHDPDSKENETAEVLISEEFHINLKFVTDESKIVHFPKSFLQKTVKELKILLFPEEISANKTIRLNYKGKLLQDCDNLSTYSLIENEVLHVVIAHENESNNLPNNIEENKSNSNDDNENLSNYSNNDSFFRIQRQGFEKLIDGSYSDKDIESLREIYHVGYQIDRYSFSRIQMIEKEENLILSNNNVLMAQLRKIQQARTLKEEGTYIHFIIGCILGYFFNLFNLGIYINFIINFILGWFFHSLICLIMLFLEYPSNAQLGSLAGGLLKFLVISFQND